MHASVAVEDMTHETYWRQLLRWLVEGVPNPVELQTSPDRVEPGEPVTLTAEVADASWVEVNDAGVIARVTGPPGARRGADAVDRRAQRRISGDIRAL